MKMEDIFKPQMGGSIDDLKGFDAAQVSVLKSIIEDNDFVEDVLAIARTLEMNKGYESEQLTKADINKGLNAIINDCNKLSHKLENMPQSINYPLMVFEWRRLRQIHGIDDFSKLGAILDELSTHIQAVLDEQSNEKSGRKINAFEWLAAGQLMSVFEQYKLPYTINAWENSEPSHATICLEIIFNYVGKYIERSSIEEYIKDTANGNINNKITKNQSVG